ncbi:MAG: hypothetical protein HYW23_02285 [Candidatus Aenigmarchaeota archaeon]|nr:hypothetical protein [Candidatus Aenigmarchaeota archaeon]
MLSDSSIKDYIGRGLLKVGPSPQIGPASIDLHIGNQLFRSNAQAHFLHNQEVDKLNRCETFLEMLEKMEEPGALPFDQYVARFGDKVPETDGRWVLEPNKQYYAQTAENITIQRGVHTQIATRSSSARNGLRVQYSEEKLDKADAFEGKPFLVINTYGTHIELPKNYPMCQMVVEPSRKLFTEEIKEGIRNGDIDVSGGSPVIYSDSLILTFHPKLLRYNGKTINPAKDSSGCFDEVDITHGYVLESGRFYLASTQETVGIGKRHAGVLHELGIMPLDSYRTHLNAPYHWPGSKHSITLEIVSSIPRHVKAGDFACRLLFEELHPECESVYNSRYNGQVGPTVSRGNLPKVR